MGIQLTKARRGLYTVSEYKTYRGQFVTTDIKKTKITGKTDLPLGYEPIIYMKCLTNGHLYPIPGSNIPVMTYSEFIERDFEHYPFECPACGALDVQFKYCKLEDQPRTWNDSNHQYIENERERLDHPLSSMYQMDHPTNPVGIARPYWEDYFPVGHTNHDDTFADHEVYEGSTNPKFYSPSGKIADGLMFQAKIPPTDVYDGIYLVKRAGEDMPEFKATTQINGKYTQIRYNYDFYRAILYVVTQINIRR